MKKRLYRDTEHQKIFGVCSGMAEYFDIDVVVLRVIWVLAILFAGSGLLAYLILALVMDTKAEAMQKEEAEQRKKTVVDDDPFAKYDKR
ncbi:MAG: PspC domain-containing protein [Bacillus subtilis]|nr:PspC domain-containing protein [Bacillus subtilis]